MTSSSTHVPPDPVCYFGTAWADHLRAPMGTGLGCEPCGEAGYTRLLGAPMTLQDRADAYATAFPQYPASHLRVVEEQGAAVLYGTWLGGNNYRSSTGFYGSYPPGYLPRIMALFPDVHADILHVFSGSLPPGPYLRVDCNPNNHPDLVGDAAKLRQLFGMTPGPRLVDGFRLVLADPPYSPADAKKYRTPMPVKRAVLASIAEVTRPGGHLVWLDTCWPLHRKDTWRTVGRIAIVRSTNHRLRMATIFERAA